MGSNKAVHILENDGSHKSPRIRTISTHKLLHSAKSKTLGKSRSHSRKNSYKNSTMRSKSGKKKSMRQSSCRKMFMNQHSPVNDFSLMTPQGFQK